MKAALDRFGRVIIPKKIREHLGLDAGKMLSIEENEGAVLLKPVQCYRHCHFLPELLQFSHGDLSTRISKLQRSGSSIISRQDEGLTGYMSHL